MGAPTKYRPEYDEQARNLCLLGATDKELAVFFGVQESTINNWKLEHKTFLESIKEAKEGADAKVANSLYEKALAGDTTAMIFWLKNRRKQHWRDKQEVENTGEQKLIIETRKRAN